MKHEEMIDVLKAHKEGKVIQVLLPSCQGAWEDIDTPRWDFSRFSYRIKPEPKPDIVRYVRANFLEYDICYIVGQVENKKSTRTYWILSKSSNYNLKATFDGETLQFKSVEIIK